MKVLKEVLESVKPSTKEEKELISKVNSFVKKVNIGLIGAKAVLYGSGAKGTWLKDGGFDADIFIKYDYKKFSSVSDKLSDMLGKHLRSKFKNLERMHGSRDYYRIVVDEIVYEIIPILDIKDASEAKNITDISPLHAKWVKSKGGKLSDDIRLAKAFLKANDLYGAESYIKGFSGYVTEILVIYYGGFLKFLRGALKWKDKQVIDISKFHKNVMMELNKSKLDSPIIVVDPVDKSRNAAAALSYSKVSILKELAKKFLRKGGKEYFEKKDFSLDELVDKNKKKRLVVVDYSVGSGKEDVIGARIVKSYEFILDKLNNYEFKVLDSGWNWNKAKKGVLWFVFGNEDLSEFKEHPGPSKDKKDHCVRFKKKHRNVVVRDGRLYAKVKRYFVDPKKFLKFLLKDKWFKGKVDFKGLK